MTYSGKLVIIAPRSCGSLVQLSRDAMQITARNCRENIALFLGCRFLVPAAIQQHYEKCCHATRQRRRNIYDVQCRHRV